MVGSVWCPVQCILCLVSVCISIDAPVLLSARASDNGSCDPPLSVSSLKQVFSRPVSGRPELKGRYFEVF